MPLEPPPVLLERVIRLDERVAQLRDQSLAEDRRHAALDARLLRAEDVRLARVEEPATQSRASARTMIWVISGLGALFAGAWPSPVSSGTACAS